MSIKSWNIFILISLLAMLGIGGGFLYLNNLQKQSAELVAEKQALKEAADKRQATLEAVEDFLNGFLREVNDAAREYKQRRVILTNLAQPENMTTPEYIAENGSLAESTLMALQLQMDKIMGVFKTADEKFEALVGVLKEGDQPAVRRKWEDERKAQTDLFMGYFSSEQSVLKAYGDLIRFYAEKKDTLKIDSAAKTISFEAPEDHAKHDELKAALKSAQEQQAEFLKPEAQTSTPAQTEALPTAEPAQERAQ
jgi:class 3 adenylate cyclase